jgi:CRP-like cAMP-binding protein
MNLLHAVRDHFLLRGLGYGEIVAIVRISEEREFRPGEPLMTAGEDSTDMMILLDGSARIVTPEGATVAELKAGRLIGEIAWLDGAPRSATILSDDCTRVAVIPFDRLRLLLDEQPNIELVLLRNLSKVICHHIRRNNLELGKYYALTGS